MKYHVNSKTGRAGQCRVTKRGCPLGADTPHFDTKEEAQAHIEKTEEAANDKFSSFSKNNNNVNQLTEWESKELKALGNMMKQEAAAKLDLNDNHAVGRSAAMNLLSTQYNKIMSDSNPTFEQLSEYKNHLKTVQEKAQDSIVWVYNNSTGNTTADNEQVDYYSGYVKAYEDTLEKIENIQSEGVRRSINDAKLKS